MDKLIPDPPFDTATPDTEDIQFEALSNVGTAVRRFDLLAKTAGQSTQYLKSHRDLEHFQNP